MKYTARPWQSTASLARGMSIFSPRTTATPQQANPVTDSIACARGGAIDLQRLAPGKGAHALSLARLGFTVHPLENRSKKPHLKDYKRLATADEPTIIGWWERWPDANPGIVVPQGRIRIDIDRRRGGDRSLAILGFVRDTCIKWSQDVSGLKTVASHDAFLHQLKLKSVVS